MSDATERLRVMAREAIAEYNTETAAGGEPPYPDWADDILRLVDQVDAIERAPLHEVERVIKERLPDGRRLGINWDAVRRAAERDWDPQWITYNTAEVMAVYYSAPGRLPLFVPFEVYRALEVERDRMRKTLENIASGHVDPDKIKAVASAALQGESKS